MKKFFALFVVAVAIASSQPAVVQTQNAGAEFVAGEVVIQFHPDASTASAADAREWVGAVRRELLRRNGSGELELARVRGISVDQAVALLRQHPAVRYAEPNWIYRHAASNDPYYTSGQLWGMLGDTTTPANQFGSQAGEAWAAGNTGSASVVVGVIDEGVDINHPDLAANIWTNPVEQGGIAGVDDDGNGYVDDLHGWDFAQNNSSVYDGAPGDNDTDSHGTHVSGTIGASGNNALGVAGVNWNVTIVPAKFLGPSGGTLANAIKAVDYLTDLKSRHGLNLVATNNSWGGGGFSQTLLDAIVRGANAGILFVAAAGNGNFFGQPINNDVTPNYPSNYNTTAGAGYDAVIAVASLTSTGARSSWSNYGQTTVDLGAPGSGIWSTTPNNTYSSFSGTSMATPHVTGAVALYASLNPAASALAIRNAILASATATPTASLTNITVTNGRLNIGEFAGPPPPPPPAPPANAPSNLTAAAVSSSQINLAWQDNSADEDGFEIMRCQGAGCAPVTVIASVDAVTVSFNNTGLSGSTLYRYQVRAFNAGGASAPSNEAEATTQTVPAAPAAPSGLTATAGPGSGLIDLAWADNSTNEDGFRVERCSGSNCTSFTQIAQLGANVTSYRDTNRRTGKWFRYRVRAFNASGNSAYSNTASVKAP